MPIPNHKPGCESYAFPTLCPDCGKKVFFLGCSCGSKVFFDALGEPWPLHSESCPVYCVRLLIEEGRSAKDIHALLDRKSKIHGQPIPLEVEKFLQKMGAGGKKHVKVMYPTVKPVEITAHLIEVRSVNIFKRLKLSETEFMRKVLGKFGAEPYSEMIVQKQTEIEQIVEQWTFLLPSAQIKGYRLTPGMVIMATLVGEKIFDEDFLWIATEIDWQ